MSALLDWWTGADKEIARGQALDQRIGDLDRELVSAGIWTDAQYEASQRAKAENAATNYSGQVADSFGQGWNEGAANVQGVIKQTIAAPLQWTLGTIPPIAWLVLAVGIFLYMGGGLWLKGAFSRA